MQADCRADRGAPTRDLIIFYRAHPALVQYFRVLRCARDRQACERYRFDARSCYVPSGRRFEFRCLNWSMRSESAIAAIFRLVSKSSTTSPAITSTWRCRTGSHLCKSGSLARQDSGSQNEQCFENRCPFSSAWRSAMGTDRTPEREGPRISLLQLDGESVGCESVSATQVEAASSFTRNQRSRISRLPALQRLSSIFIARAAESDSGTARTCLSRFADTRCVHAFGVGRERGGGATRWRADRKSREFCQLNCNSAKRACRRKSASPSSCLG